MVWALAAATIILAGRRDLGASILPASDTAAPRTRLLNGPFGLAWRLGRRGALGWLAGLAGGGLILGLTAKATEGVWAGQSGGIVAKLGGAAGGAAYLGIAFLIVALVVAMAAAGQVAATRDEEAEGYLDNLLARPVVRLPWLAGRFATSAVVITGASVITGLFTWLGAVAAGTGLSFATLLAAGVNVVPAGIFVLGAGTLVHGLAPRFAAAAAYGVVAWSFLVEIVGAGIGASHWLLDLSVLHHIARAPVAPPRRRGHPVIERGSEDPGRDADQHGGHRRPRHARSPNARRSNRAARHPPCRAGKGYLRSVARLRGPSEGSAPAIVREGPRHPGPRGRGVAIAWPR